MDVSEKELVKHIHTILRETDPTSLTSLNDVVQTLESQLGFNLSHKTNFIKDQINLVLGSHPTLVQNPNDHFAPDPQFGYSHFVNPDQQMVFKAEPDDEKGSELLKRNHFVNPDQQIVFKAEADSQDAEIKGSDVAKRNQFVNRTQQMVFKAEAALRDAGIIGSDVAKRYHFVSPNPQMVFKAEADAQDAEIKGSDVAKSVPAKKRGGVGGLNKVCGVTPELQVIVGQPALPRTEIVKQLWAYIRRNNLQDPSNKRKIICDDPLRAVFEIDCTDMFQMNKLLSKHIIRLEPPKEESNQAKKLKVESVDGGLPTGNGEPGPILVMSEALAHFFGTGEREVSKAEVLERIWAYIMVNKLEDPTNKNVILCDPKLQQLLGCESISTWEVPGMIDRHLFQRF